MVVRYSEAQTSCAAHGHSSLVKEAIRWPLEHHPVAVGYQFSSNVFRIYFFIKTLGSISTGNLLVYTIEWKWNLHLGRLKVFWFFLDQIVRNL